MSQTRWRAPFKKAVYTAVVDPTIGDDGMVTDPSRTITNTGELAPQDLVGHEVRHYLAQDPVLRHVFSDRIEFMPLRNALDFRQFPRLQVYLTSNDNSERPTAVSLENVTVYVGIRADQSLAEPVKDGEATVATVMARIKRVLRATKASRLVIWKGGRQRNLAMDIAIGGERLLVDVTIIGQNERVAFVHEVPVTYRIDVDRTTGQIINLQAA